MLRSVVPDFNHAMDHLPLELLRYEVPSSSPINKLEKNRRANTNHSRHVGKILLSAVLVAAEGTVDPSTMKKQNLRTDKVFSRTIRQTVHAFQSQPPKAKSDMAVNTIEECKDTYEMSTNTSQSLLLSLLPRSKSLKEVSTSTGSTSDSDLKLTDLEPCAVTELLDWDERSSLESLQDNSLHSSLSHASLTPKISHSSSRVSFNAPDDSISAMSEEHEDKREMDDHCLPAARGEETARIDRVQRDSIIRQFFNPRRHREHLSRLNASIASPSTSSEVSGRPHGRGDNSCVSGLSSDNYTVSTVYPSPRTCSPRSRGHSPRRENDLPEEDWMALRNRKIYPNQVDEALLTPTERQAMKVIIEVRKSKKKGKEFEGKPLSRAEVNLLRR